ncbi:hypothetical protein [Phenylobacterium sp. SCN 70-31]|uniref:hypothetical protein n=1 Tax=Phenylobacterium sp. SCN 70-31 TaxID=1660129 RepID=UPI0025CD3300|nr:hypothetical protein [Phenylobacterium sp. SCN 70-31]
MKGRVSRTPRRRDALSGLVGVAGLAGAGMAVGVASARAGEGRWRVRRLVDRPIIAPGMDSRMGDNIEGPSLIRAPDWLPGRLGRYYLYFADHKGDYIRLAYADRLEGPWTVHAPGSLDLAQSGFPTVRQSGSPEAEAKLLQGAGPNRAPPGTPGIPSPLDDATLPHIASPDVHVDHERRRIVMYHHGLSAFTQQRTRVAISMDGVSFRPLGETLGPAYMRVFPHAGQTYAMAMPGIFLRSPDGFAPFEVGPRLFGIDQRHSALLQRGDTLHVFWTRVGDAPERIYVSDIDISGDWAGWKAGPPVEVLRPERPWEGAGLPLVPSYRSAINLPANQLRDPAIYEEGGRVYMVYAVQGERGLGIVELGLPA